MSRCQACGAIVVNLRPGQTWFAELPGDLEVTCVMVDEVTAKTVVLREQADTGSSNTTVGIRYARVKVTFVEKVP